jgi:hypothetical protein
MGVLNNFTGLCVTAVSTSPHEPQAGAVRRKSRRFVLQQGMTFCRAENAEIPRIGLEFLRENQISALTC